MDRPYRLVAALGVAIAGLGALQPAVAKAPEVSFSVVATIPVAAGAEIVAASENGRYLAVAGDTEVTLIDFRDAQDVSVACTVDLASIGDSANVTSVAFAGSMLGLASVKDGANPGTLVGFAVPGCEVLWEVELGIGPDSVVVSPNGRYAVVAIEDEENEVGTITTCPAGNVRPGEVNVVDLTAGPNAAPDVRTVPIDLSGVAGVNCATDPQPEGVDISRDSQTAFVTLQENNALATIDLASAEVTSVSSLGLTTHLADLIDGAAISITQSMTARRESDGIAYLNGYLFTADEGDTSKTGDEWSGGRTMSVFQADGTLVGDTGAMIEQLVADNGGWPAMADRSNNRGPEPEGVVAFSRRGASYAVITLERANGVAIFDVSSPSAPEALTFLPTGVGPEGIAYINQRGLVVTANEVGRTLTVICIQNGSGSPNSCR